MDKNISDLSEKTTASGTDYLIIEDTSHTYKISKANLSKDKIDEVSISGNTLTFKANGVVITTITLPSGDGHTHSNKTVLDTITEALITSWNNKSDFSGDYNDLNNKPTIPNLSGYATKTYVANAIANAQLDGSEVDLSGYATKDDLHSHSNKTVLDGITNAKVTAWNNKSDFSGSYNDLTNKPTIPTQTSQLTNNSGFLTSIPSEYITETELAAKGYLTQHQSLSGYATQTYVNNKVSGLATKNEIGDLSYLLTTNKTNLVQAINELYQLIGNINTTVAVQSVSLNKTTTSLNVGNSMTLTATINPSNATNKYVTWSCNNSNVTLSSNGLTCTVTGVKTGTSVVTVRTEDGNKTATCNVTIAEQSQTYGNIVVSSTSASVNENQTTTFTVKLDKQPTNNQIVNLSVNNGNCSINKSSLTFTPSNYSTTQTVTITGAHNSTTYTDLTSTITLSSANVSSKTISVTVVNIDTQPPNENLEEIAYPEFGVWSIDGSPTVNTKGGQNIDLSNVTGGNDIPYSSLPALEVGSTYVMTCNECSNGLLVLLTLNYSFTEEKQLVCTFVNNKCEFVADKAYNSIALACATYPSIIKLTNFRIYKKIEIPSLLSDFSEWTIDNSANATITTKTGNNLDMISNGNDARPYTTFTPLTVGNKYKFICDYIDSNLKFEFWTADYGTTFEVLASNFVNNSYEFTATSALATVTISSATSFPMTLKITNMVFFESGVSSGGGETGGETGSIFSVIDPYANAGSTIVKFQPHIHTTDSDGRQDNATVVNAYKNAGYTGLAITNHNSPSKGYTALSAQQNIDGITHIRGTEESQDAKHIGVIGCTSVAGDTTDKPTILAYHRQNNPNAFLILNHPNLSLYGGNYSDDEIKTLDYDCMELFDAAYDSDYPTNVEDKWDMALSSGKHIWGSCSDDCHDVTDADGYDEFDHGYINILVSSNNQTNILSALKAGQFYACVRHDIRTSYNSSTKTLTATSSVASKFEFIGKNSTILKTVNNATSASYTFNGSEMYVRVKSTKVSNTEDRAYSQPFWVTVGGSSEGTVAVQSVSLNNSTTSIDVNGTTTLTAIINPSNATNKNVTWSCNNSNVTLSSNGLNCTVTGVTVGTSVVTVTTADGNKTATCTITVNSSSSTETTSIFRDFSLWDIDNSANATITTKSGNNLDMISNGNDARPYTTFTELTVGNTYRITCDYIDSNLKFEFWTADYVTSFEVLASDFTNNSYEFIATSALATVTISSTTSFPMTLKVTNMVFFESGTSSGGNTVAVQSVSLNKSTASIDVGGTTTLTATITPSNATNKNVLWSFSNSNVTLSSNGLTCTVTGAKAGTSVVTVRTVDGNKTATCNVTINATATETLKEISYPAFDNWNLSSSSTGTLVTRSGKNFEITNVTSVKDSPYVQLTTTLTTANTYVFKANEVSANCTIELDVDMYMDNPTVLDFSSGYVEFTPDKEYSWIAINSSDYSNGVIKVTNFTINKKTSGSSSGGGTTIAVQGVSLNSTAYTVEQGSSFPLTAIFNPLDATNKNVTWSASNSNVRLATSTVNCTVTGVTVGTSIVTVTTADGGYKATCTVTVSASSSGGSGGTSGDYSTTLVTPALVSAVDDGNYDIGYFNEGTLGSSGINGNIYYLSPSGSDTSGSGTSSSPWKSINKVRTYVDNLSSKPSKVTILMADGDYNVTETQVIRGTTFGTSSCPVEIRGIGNKAKITTGTKLTGYTQTTMNGKTCYSYNLSSVSGWNSGNNVFEPTKQDSVPDYDQIKNNKYQCNVTDMPFVSVNGEKLWLASYPNKQDVVFQTGVTGNDGGASGFNNNQTVVIPSGTVRTKLNSFSQLSNISSTKNKVYVQMYWTAKYFAETLLIRGYNSSTGTLTMSAGCLNEDTSPYSSQKFRFYNIKEQLNEESTYWIDYDNNKLYLIPPTGTNMSTAEVVLSHVKNSATASSNTLIATNSSAQTYVTFERINFCDHRGNVFLGTSSNKLNGVKFFKCRFVNIGRSVFGCNTTYGHYAGTGGTDIVTNCEWRQCRFGNIGEFALFVVGANRNTNSLYSDNNKVYNCVFNKGANTGTYLCNKVHFIYYYGCGMEVKGSKFANHPGQAILWRANDFIINDNIFYQNTWSEADAGTIYSGCDWSFRGVQITNNKFYAGYQADRRIGEDYSGTVGVYLDDLYSSATVSGNYIEGFQKGILMGGGRDNIIQNNTIVNCGQGLIADDRGLSWAIGNFEPNMLFTNSVPWSNWKSKYPALGTLNSDINNNVKPYGNTIKNNTCRGCHYNIGINSNVSSLGTVSGNTNS